MNDKDRGMLWGLCDRMLQVEIKIDRPPHPRRVLLHGKCGLCGGWVVAGEESKSPSRYDLWNDDIINTELSCGKCGALADVTFKMTDRRATARGKKER